ncbi:MAG: aldo/keto reductase [Treponema sp.]|nr:aldo/keto reductase [Treponema sp.]
MEIKKLGFGLMRLPYSESEEYGHADLEKTREMVDAYMAEGFTYFDTAAVYHGGHSERVFGEVVAKRYPREKFQVTSKMPVWDLKEEGDLDRIFNEQLKKCNIEYFDYYFMHAMGVGNYAKAQQFHGFEWMQKMKAEGKIKHPGFSFHDSPEVLEQILTEHPEVELVQLQINYIDWESNNVQSRACYEIAMKHGKKVAVMEPVKGGSLANVMGDAKKVFTDYNPSASVASWAIRYAASLDNILVVLSGMSNMEQLKDNMSYMKDFKPLNEEERACVQKATDLIKNTIAIPCTACRYCTDGCPKKINIPRYFELFNEAGRYGANSFKWNYNEELKKGGNPADCIACRACEKHCPQKIQIVDELKKVVELFK